MHSEFDPGLSHAGIHTYSGGVDSTTISALTGNPYKVTIAAYGSATDILSFKPSSKGYAIFDVTVNGKLAGSITLYVVFLSLASSRNL